METKLDSIFLSLKIIYASFGTNAEAYSEICETSKFKRCAQIINSFFPLIIFEKRYILYVQQGSGCAPEKFY